MKTQDIKNMGLAMQQVQEAEVDRFTMAPRVKGPGATDSKKDDPAEKKRRADKAAKIKAAIKTSRAGAQFTATTRESANEVQEAGTATHKPNNGSDPEQGLSPNAKKEKARTSGVGVDANDSIAKSFKAFKAASKAAKQNGGRTPPGDKAVVKSTMAPAANQKTESVNVVAEVKQGKSIKGKIGDPIKAAYHGEDNSNDTSDDGEGMDKVQPKAAKKKFANRKDKDIDNDGDTDSSDEYLHKRRKAISSKMKSKREDAVMHGGKTGAKSEKKEKETMSVGEGAMKRMSSGDGMDTYKKKPKDEDMGKAVGHAMRATGEVGDSAVKGVARTVGYASGLKKGIKKAYAQGKAKASDDDDEKKKNEAFSSSAIVKKDRRGDGKPMGDPRQMKDPKKDSMVSKDGKVKVIDKDKEKDHLKKGFVRAEAVGDGSRPMLRPTSDVTTASSARTSPIPKKRPVVPSSGIKKSVSNALSSIGDRGSPAVSKPLQRSPNTSRASGKDGSVSYKKTDKSTMPPRQARARDDSKSRPAAKVDKSKGSSAVSVPLKRGDSGRSRGSDAVSVPKPIYKGGFRKLGKSGRLPTGGQRYNPGPDGRHIPAKEMADYSAPKMNQVTPNTSNAMSKYKTVPTLTKTPKRPAKPQMGMDAPAAKKGRPY